MREKLEKIIDAYEELEQKLGDPQILADQHEYNKLAKSYADQGPLVVAARKYVHDLNDLAEAKEMLSDADMKEFAQEEISRIEGELPQLEEDIKFMLIPSVLLMRRTSLLKFVQLRAATKRQFLLAICIKCTCVLPTIMAGKWRPWTSLLPKRAATRKSSSR